MHILTGLPSWIKFQFPFLLFTTKRTDVPLPPTKPWKKHYLLFQKHQKLNLWELKAGMPKATHVIAAFTSLQVSRQRLPRK